MGRGRSKAKQTKVARDLKYSNQDMDLEKLTEELHKDKESKKFDFEFNEQMDNSSKN